MGLTAEFVHELTGCAVAFEGGGHAAWAYFKAPEGAVIGDVWLYNVGPAPEAVDFSDPAAAPFQNPAALARPLAQPLPTRRDELEVCWTLDGELLLADLHLRGELLGRLSPGSQPGWATHARGPGPLALPLEAGAPRRRVR